MLYIHDKKPYSISFYLVEHKRKMVSSDKYQRRVETYWVEEETICTLSSEKGETVSNTIHSYKDRFRVNYGRAIALYRALMKMIKRNIMTPNEVYSWTLSCPIFKPFNTSRKRWSKFMFDATRVFQKNN